MGSLPPDRLASSRAKLTPRNSTIRMFSAIRSMTSTSSRSLAPLKLWTAPADGLPGSRISSVVPSRPRFVSVRRISCSFSTYSLCFFRVTRYSGGWAMNRCPSAISGFMCR